MIYFPNCKINIGLDVLRRRADGFHDIETLMYPVYGLSDILEIVPSRSEGVVFSQTGINMDCAPENNLCIRAYNLMRQKYGVGGVKIHLHKVIPAGAGLGGGSSDAAFTIKGLDRIFALGLGTEKMEELAAELGSDTAFFIRNEPQLARGRGQILTPYPIALTGRILLIIKPDVHISTAEAYAGITPLFPAKTLEDRLASGDWKNNIINAFEPSLFKRHPDLERIKESLYGYGAEYVSLSGSGSAIYGIFECREGYTGGVKKCVCANENGETTHDPRTLKEETKMANIIGKLKNEYGEIFVYQQLTK